jgi:hypothetical protein
MAPAQPELLFVAGPQTGERAVLMANVAVLGRGQTADVRIEEEHVSRDHVKFQLTHQGWIVQNLSHNGTLVNGKRYRKPKQILLDTGDVLGVGMETEILYVSPGDDPEEALQIYRQAHPQGAEKPKPYPKPAAKRAAEAASSEGGPPPLPGEAAPAAQPARPVMAKAVNKPADDELVLDEEEQNKGNRLKIILFICLLAGVLVFGFVLIAKSMQDDDDGPTGDRAPIRLTDEQVSEALADPLERTPSITKAAAALDEAVQRYSNRTLWEPGDRYRCLYHFKLYLAHSTSKSFARIQDERAFHAVQRELDALVRKKYDTAWMYEQDGNYRDAQTVFEEFLHILPMEHLRRGEKIRDVVMENVIDHLNFIKEKTARKKVD